MKKAQPISNDYSGEMELRCLLCWKIKPQLWVQHDIQAGPAHRYSSLKINYCPSIDEDQ